jgi:uncharacterized membrane protein
LVIHSLTASLVIGLEEKTSGAVPIVAFAGVLASLIVYHQLQMGAFRSMQLASTLAEVARRGREVIDALYTPNRAAGRTQRPQPRARKSRPPPIATRSKSLPGSSQSMYTSVRELAELAAIWLVQ